MLVEHIQIDLEITPKIIDQSLYCKFENNRITGINGSYADDLIRTRNNEWMTQADANLERFKKMEMINHLYIRRNKHHRETGYA